MVVESSPSSAMRFVPGFCVVGKSLVVPHAIEELKDRLEVRRAGDPGNTIL